MGNIGSNCCCGEEKEGFEYWTTNNARLERHSVIDKSDLGFPFGDTTIFQNLALNYQLSESRPIEVDDNVLWLLALNRQRTGAGDRYRFMRLDVSNIDNIQILSDSVFGFPVEWGTVSGPLFYQPSYAFGLAATDRMGIGVVRDLFRPAKIPAGEDEMPYPYVPSYIDDQGDPSLPTFALYAIDEDFVLFTDGAGILKINANGTYDLFSNTPESVGLGHPMILGFGRRHATRCIGQRITDVEFVDPKTYRVTYELVVGELLVPQSQDDPRMTVDEVVDSWVQAFFNLNNPDGPYGPLDLDYNVPNFPHGLGYPLDSFVGRVQDFDANGTAWAAYLDVSVAPFQRYYNIPAFATGVDDEPQYGVFVTTSGHVVSYWYDYSTQLIGGQTAFVNQRGKLYVNGTLIHETFWPGGLFLALVANIWATEFGNGLIFVARPYHELPAPHLPSFEGAGFNYVGSSYQGVIVDPNTMTWVPYYKIRQNGDISQTPRPDGGVEGPGIHGVPGTASQNFGYYLGLRLREDRLTPARDYYFKPFVGPNG